MEKDNTDEDAHMTHDTLGGHMVNPVSLACSAAGA